MRDYELDRIEEKILRWRHERRDAREIRQKIMDEEGFEVELYRLRMWLNWREYDA